MQNENGKKSKVDNRTPTHGLPAPDKQTQTTNQDRADPPTQATAKVECDGPFTLISRPVKKSNATKSQPTRKATSRSAVVLVKVGNGRSYADTLREVRGVNIQKKVSGEI